MAMYNAKLQKQVKQMFRDLQTKADEVITSSSTYRIASERMMNMVSSRVSAETEGYIIDLYASFAERIRKEEFFQNPEHLNAFYRLNLREELNSKYHFEIGSLDAYKKGIDYDEINRLYASLGVMAGTLAVGGILKFAISGAVNMPCAAYFKIVPKKNKKEFRRAVNKFLNDLENDILNWFVDVENFFESRVRTLY